MLIRTISILLSLLITVTTTSNAQNILGTWKTVDEKSGQAKSHVEIFQDNGKYYGVISEILLDHLKDSRCTACKGEKKDLPKEGLEIIMDLELDSETGEYTNGKVLHPDNGKLYHLEAKVSDQGSTLILHGGYRVLGRIVGRSQRWYRVK